MKFLFHLLATLFALADPTSAQVRPPSECICPAVVIPVCSVDNVTYNNDCELQCTEEVRLS